MAVRGSVPALVSADWLLGQLPAPDLRVLDASWYMPGDARDAHALYVQAHIPGAMFFDIDAIADPESSLPHMMPTAARFERLVGALGVGSATRVVVYDQSGILSAPRAWWMLRVFGHERCAVLDGGLPAWRRAGGALASGAEAPQDAGPFRASFHAGLIRGLGDVLANLGTHRELVLDARSGDRFHARVPEPRAGLLGGHIPGSVSLPFTELLTATQTLKTPGELRESLAQRGVTEQTQVITTCGSGLTAAVINLALQVAGLPPGALYDGSWSEWGGRTDTPVER